MTEKPIRPSDVILESDRILSEKADSIIRELNPTLTAALKTGGGRNEKIYIILSSAARDLMSARPDVERKVLAAYEETGEWIIYCASEYQWEFYVADSPAGRSIQQALAVYA